MRRGAIGGVLVTAALATMVAGCWRKPKPKLLGDSPALAPAVEVRRDENRVPSLFVQLPQAAYVNAFLVTPGEETVILYPPDSTTAPRLESGGHDLPTFFGRRALPGDTGRILRGRGGGGQRTTGGGGGQMGGNEMAPIKRWILVYASQDSIPSRALRERVMGFTVPGYTDEALNTVARTVRSITPRGPWAAVAIEFYP